MTVFGSAPGKIILFGEHAVVHGQPAIAVPLSTVQVQVSVAPAPPGSGLIVYASDIRRTVRVPLQPVPAKKSLASALAFPLQLVLETLDKPMPDMRLTVRSTIPIASGLGSGAAIATALARALSAALGQPLSNDELNPLIYEVEKRHHGTPSGIDNTVVVYEQPVYFVRGHSPEAFAIAQPFTLIVGDTGHASPTRITVGDVGALYEAEPERISAIFQQIGTLVRDARRAIESGTMEELGPMMDANHALLVQLTVSSAALDVLCEAARGAGALGAKLSGGGRGGNMIALSAPERADEVVAALRGAGAVRVIQTMVGV